MSESWIVGADGFPATVYMPAPAPAMEEPYPHYAWRSKKTVNGGIPFTYFMPGAVELTLNRVFQPEYVTIYDGLSPADDFNTHGLCVLSPTKCEVTEEIKGKWTVLLEHPYDADNRWEHIKVFNTIKAFGQLFPIVNVDTHRPGHITARAEHIFYYLNDRWIFPGASIVTNSVKGLLALGHNAAVDFTNENQRQHTFRFDSDISDRNLNSLSNAKFGNITEGMSYADFIMGTGNVLDMSGGELYRDNFYFSINKRMENSNDNAFEIRVGKDLTGIKRTVDVSQMCTYFRVYNGLDSTHSTWFAISYTDAVVGSVAPHSIVRSKTFTAQIPPWITDEDEIAQLSDELVAEEAMRFFHENCSPKIVYEINIEDVSKNPDFIEFKNLPDYRVGNIGMIFDERFNTAIQMKITKTVKDAITGKTISVTFGEPILEYKIEEGESVG